MRTPQVGGVGASWARPYERSTRRLRLTEAGEQWQPRARQLLAVWQDGQAALRISDRLTDLVQDPVDCAVRYGEPPDASLVTVPLAPGHRRVLCGRLRGRWHFTSPQGEARAVEVTGRIGDDGGRVREWAVAGRGGRARAAALDGRRPAPVDARAAAAGRGAAGALRAIAAGVNKQRGQPPPRGRPQATP